MTRPRDIADGINRIDTSAADATAITIDSSENVGIGTSSPLAAGSSYTVVDIGSASTASLLNMTDNGTETGRIVAQDDQLHLSSGTASGFIGFRTGGFSSSTERMRITSSGFVSIGDNHAAGASGMLHLREDSGAGSPDIILERDDSSVGINNQIGSLQFWAGEDGSEEKVAAVRAVADDNYTSSSSATRLIFETATSGSTSATEKARLDSAGQLFIGCTSSPDASTLGAAFMNDGGGSRELRISSPVTTTDNVVLFYNPNGNVGRIQTFNSATNYSTSSDYRLKENVTGITDGITRVKQLNPSRFNFIANANITVDGFLAHEAATVVPEAVTGEKDAVDADGNPDYQGIDQSKLVPLLTAALQEAITKIETLEAKVTALESA